MKCYSDDGFWTVTTLYALICNDISTDVKDDDMDALKGHLRLVNSYRISKLGLAYLPTKTYVSPD